MVHTGRRLFALNFFHHQVLIWHPLSFATGTLECRGMLRWRKQLSERFDHHDELAEKNYNLPYFERFAHLSFLRFFPFLPTYDDRVYSVNCDVRKRFRRWKKQQKRRKSIGKQPGARIAHERRRSMQPPYPHEASSGRRLSTWSLQTLRLIK